MNEEALQTLYGIAKGNGYAKSYDEFKVLMGENGEAVQQMYSLAKGEGYAKTMDDFNVLVGFSPAGPVKKKDATESVSADGSLVSQPARDIPHRQYGAGEVPSVGIGALELAEPLEGEALAKVQEYAKAVEEPVVEEVQKEDEFIVDDPYSLTRKNIQEDVPYIVPEYGREEIPRFLEQDIREKYVSVSAPKDPRETLQFKEEFEQRKKTVSEDVGILEERKANDPERYKKDKEISYQDRVRYREEVVPQREKEERDIKQQHIDLLNASLIAKGLEDLTIDLDSYERIFEKGELLGGVDEEAFNELLGPDLVLTPEEIEAANKADAENRREGRKALGLQFYDSMKRMALYERYVDREGLSPMAIKQKLTDEAIDVERRLIKNYTPTPGFYNGFVEDMRFLNILPEQVIYDNIDKIQRNRFEGRFIDDWGNQEFLKENRHTVVSEEKYQELLAGAYEGFQEKFGEHEWEQWQKISGINDPVMYGVQEDFNTVRPSEIENAVVIGDEDATVANLRSAFPRKAGDPSGFVFFGTGKVGEYVTIQSLDNNGRIVNSLEVYLEEENDPVEKIRDFMQGALLTKRTKGLIDYWEEVAWNEDISYKERNKIRLDRINYILGHPEQFGDSESHSVRGLDKSLGMISYDSIEHFLDLQKRRGTVSKDMLDAINRKLLMSQDHHARGLAQKGSWASAIAMGVADLPVGIAELMTAATLSLPNPALSNEERKELKKIVFKGLGQAREEFTGTTEESMAERGIGQELLRTMTNMALSIGYGSVLTKSLGLSGAKPWTTKKAKELLATGAGFGMQTSGRVSRQMLDADIPEWQKGIIALPVGMTEAMLEGLFVNRFMNPEVAPLFLNAISKTLKDLPRDASKRAIEAAMKRSITAKAKSLVAKGVELSATEAATEGYQYISEDAYKRLYNAVYDMEAFKLPDFLDDTYLKQLTHAVKLGALAGPLAGGAFHSLSMIRNGFNKASQNAEFEQMYNQIKNPQDLAAARVRLKTKALEGVISESELNQLLQSLENAYSLVQEIPEELKLNDKREAFTLLREKKILEREIEGKSPELVSEQRRKIKEINQVLEVIGQRTPEESEKAKDIDEILYEWHRTKPDRKWESVEDIPSVEEKTFVDEIVVEEEAPLEEAPKAEVTEVTEEEAPAEVKAPVVKGTKENIRRAKEKGLSQEEVDSVLREVIEKTNKEVAKRKTPPTPEQIKAKMTPFQRVVFDNNIDRYAELTQEQVTEEAPVAEETTKTQEGPQFRMKEEVVEKGQDVEIRYGRSVDRGDYTLQNVIVSYKGEDITGQSSKTGKANEDLGNYSEAGKEGGHLYFVMPKNSNDAYVGSISIPEKLRGKGVASKIYQALANHSNKTIKDSSKYESIVGGQSESGKAIWKNRDSFTPAKKETPKRKRRRKKPVVKQASVAEEIVPSVIIDSYNKTGNITSRSKNDIINKIATKVANNEELSPNEKRIVEAKPVSKLKSSREGAKELASIIKQRSNDIIADRKSRQAVKVEEKVEEKVDKRKQRIKEIGDEIATLGNRSKNLVDKGLSKEELSRQRGRISRKKTKLRKERDKLREELKTKKTPPVVKEAPVKEAPKKKAPKKKQPVKEAPPKVDSKIKENVERVKDMRDRVISSIDNKITMLSKREGLTRAQRAEQKQKLEAQKEAKEAEYAKKIQDAKDGKEISFRFRLSDDADVEVEEGFITEDEIVEVMKRLGPAEANFKIPVGEKQVEVDPIALSKSIKKITDAQAKELGFESVADMLKNIEEFNDIPMVVAMSDVLATGTYKDSMGNDMEVGGGLLYNVLGPNKTLAWAGVNKTGAQTQFEEAMDLLRANPELFDRLWREGKLPKNLVPVAVLRMGNPAINSNEAVFRFLSPKAKSYPKANQKAAFESLIKSIEAKKNVSQKSKTGKDTVKFAQELESVIKKNKIKDVGSLFDFIVEDAKKRAEGDAKTTVALNTRALLFDMIVSPEGVGKASKPPAKALIKGTDSNGSEFLADTILSEIGEPSMLQTEAGDVVAIMGIDVSKSGGVKKAKHNNYGFGPKGRLIALIRNPMNGLDIFPEWRAKAARIFKEDKKGEMPTPEKVARQTAGAFFGDKAFRGARVQTQPSDIDIIAAKMRFAFPSVSVSQSQQEFDEVLKQEGIRTAEANGNTILGLTKDGKIFLNPSKQSLSTPIHEFGHIWIDYLRSESSKEKGTKLLNRGLELVEGTKALESAIKKYGDNALAREEALVELMGNKGETIANASKRVKFIEWFNAFFKYIKEQLTRFADIKAKDIKDITLEEFVDIGLAELFSGEAIDATFKPEQAAESAKARMQKEGVDLDASMNEAINEMIDKGFKADEIRGVLKQKGYKVRDINNALVTEINENVNLPIDFMNIEGGILQGEELFRSVMKKLKSFATPKVKRATAKQQYEAAKKEGYKGTQAQYTKEQNAKKAQEIRSLNPSLFALSDEQILKRYPNIQTTLVEKTQATKSQIRKKAIELLEAEEIFQAQDEVTKLKLLAALDRVQKTRSNKEVQKKIAGIKQSIKDAKAGSKQLQAAKTKLKNFIIENMPPSKTLNTRERNKLIRAVEKVTPTEYRAFEEKVMEVVNKELDNQKKREIKSMIELAKKKSTIKNKRARTTPEGVLFFENAERILKMVLENNTDELAQIQEELLDNDAKINEAIDKINEGEKVDDKQRSLVAKAYAFDMFGSLVHQDLSAVKEAHEMMKEELKRGVEALRTMRMARKAIYDRLREEAYEQIKAGYSFLFDEDGIPLNESEVESKKQILQNLRSDKNLKKAVTDFYRYQLKLSKGFFADYLINLGTVTRGLDRKGDFFEKNVYDRLNNMEEAYLQGYFNQLDILKSRLEAVGIKNGLDGLTKTVYDAWIVNDTLEIEGIKLDVKKIRAKKEIFSKGELMNIYALSKNAEQMNRLKNQGFTDEKINKIREFLGPQIVEAVDVIVDYLSTTYFEEVNAVYESVNDISLAYIENYFPVQSITTKSESKAELDRLAKSMKSGNFNKTLSAQMASALKERVSKGTVKIKGVEFMTVLENHLREMERFKAYAMGTKEINIIMNHTPAIQTLLSATKTQQLMHNGVNWMINPDVGRRLIEIRNPKFEWAQRQFTSMTLGLKPIQLVKQATSFINALADYKFRSEDSKNKRLRGRVVGVDKALDFIVFPIDALLGLVFNLPTAYHKSASFRNRIREGFKSADILGLETGQGARGRIKKTRLGRTLRRLKTGINLPTLVGDIIGVMGYMAAYRANIRHGMSESKAIEQFNKYNETQQTRREGEKIALQRSSSPIVRTFTMFGSTQFLQLNKVIQNARNIRRDSYDSLESITKGDWAEAKRQAPKQKDFRELYLNAGLANLLFIAASNMFKYLPWDEEDDDMTDEEREQFRRDQAAVQHEYKEALLGMNILYNLPLIGPTYETINNFAWWDDPNAFKKPKKRFINPIMEIAMDAYWDHTLNKSSWYMSTLKPVVSLMLGLPVDKPLAALERIRIMLGEDEMYRKGFEETDKEGNRKFKGTFEEYKIKQIEENMYELLGISYSYRPGSTKDKDVMYIPIPINKKSSEEDKSKKTGGRGRGRGGRGGRGRGRGN